MLKGQESLLNQYHRSFTHATQKDLNSFMQNQTLMTPFD